MLDTISARQELLTLIGQPVHVKARLTRLGALPGRDDRADYATALLEDIHLEGVLAPITHAWIRLGPNGAERARKYKLSGCPVEMSAIIVAYRGGELGNDLRLGIGDISDFIAFHGGKWRTIARNRETVDTDRGERYSQAYIDEMLSELLYQSQQDVMRELSAYAQSFRVDKALKAALLRYFGRKEPLTNGQLRHATRVLGGMPCSS